MLARHENFVEIDGNVNDAFGIPVLKFPMKWSDNEKNLMQDAMETAATALEAAGGKDIRPYLNPKPVAGYGIHEMGVARMGHDPKTSVLSAFQQAHDVKNLFVADAAGFVSGDCQNPTLTIMALAVRSSDHLLGELQRGDPLRRRCRKRRTAGSRSRPITIS